MAEALRSPAVQRQVPALGRSLIQRVAAWGGAAAIEGGLSFAFLTGSLGLAAYLGLHAIVCLGLGVAAVRNPAPDVSTDLILLTVWTAISGPIGPVLAALSWSGRALSAGTIDSRFDDLLEGDAGDPAILRHTELYDALQDKRINTGPPGNLTGLMDAVELGTQSEALAALRAAAQNFGPDLAPVIRRAALSPDAAVRVLAATILSDLKKRYTNRVSQARQALETAPNSAPAREVMFEACMAYAQSGLLSDDLASDMRRLAFTHAATGHRSSMTSETQA